MKPWSLRFIALSFAPLAGACSNAAAMQPHDMSVAQHQAAAASEENLAAQHTAQRDPNARQAEEHCEGGEGCWTEMINPTDVHKGQAKEHRELAAKHRAASQTLRDAEGRSCAGLREEDRDVSPFAHPADIQSVSQLRERETMLGETEVPHGAGATIVFRATPGMTAEWLQRVIDCHLARNAAVGHEMPEMAYCPLVPRGAHASVRSVGAGFAVDVRGDDSAAAAEIWRRSQLLAAAR